jgi:hypothetical protein
MLATYQAQRLITVVWCNGFAAVGQEQAGVSLGVNPGLLSANLRGNALNRPDRDRRFRAFSRLEPWFDGAERKFGHLHAG